MTYYCLFRWNCRNEEAWPTLTQHFAQHIKIWVAFVFFKISFFVVACRLVYNEIIVFSWIRHAKLLVSRIMCELLELTAICVVHVDFWSTLSSASKLNLFFNICWHRWCWMRAIRAIAWWQVLVISRYSLFLSTQVLSLLLLIFIIYL